VVTLVPTRNLAVTLLHNNIQRICPSTSANESVCISLSLNLALIVPLFIVVGGAVLASAVAGFLLYKALGKKQEEEQEKKQQDIDPVVREALFLFEKTFKSKATHAASAPGRVNLIGEHTDYNDGFVMPCALEYRTAVVGARNNSTVIRYISQGQIDVVQIDLKKLDAIHTPKWVNYMNGVIALYQKKGIEIPGMDIAVVGKVPLGSGLSSSAALEVSTATFVKNILGLSSSGVEIALLAQEAEHVYANVPCGIMDQFISALGKQGHALLLDCRSKVADYIPLNNPDYVVLVTSNLQTPFGPSLIVFRHKCKA
jgi:galactokinase